MKRLRLFILILCLLPVLLFFWLTMTQAGLNWAYQQAEFYLPTGLSFSQMEGKLIGPVSINDFEFQQDGMVIQAEKIIVDWLPMALLAANININQFQVKALNIVLPPAENADNDKKTEPESSLSLPEINLPWRLLLKNAEIDGLNISQNEQSYKLNKVTLDATTLFSQVTIKVLSINADDFSLNLKGKLQPTGNYQHKLNINWQAKLPSSTVIKGSGQLSGDMLSTQIKQNLRGPLQLSLDAQLLNLLNDLSWSTNIDVSQFDITKLDPGWPALSGALKLNAKGDLTTATLNGQLQGHYPELGKLEAQFDLQRLVGNTIQLEQLKLHAPQNETDLEASGTWTPGNNGGDLNLALNWKNLRWPAQEQPWFNSASGSGTLTGNIDRYKITLLTDSPWPQAAPSTWHASATGNFDGMKIQSLRIEALNGEANINGQLNWSPQLNWQAQGNLKNINPASLLPQWPGEINGKLSSKGRLENGQLIVEADINQLTGKLRDYPVSLRSRLAWRDEHLHISRLNFSSGKSRLQLNGQLGETLKLNWEVDSTDLAELYPQAKGQLQATGKLNGPVRTPLIEAVFNGNTLSYPNYEIAAIEGEMAVDLFHWQKTDIRLTAQTLKMHDLKLLSVDINSDSNFIKAQAVSDKATAQIELKGQTKAGGWHGRIEKASLLSTYFDNWQLKSPAALSIDDKSLRLEHLCLQSNQQASLCTSVNHSEAGLVSSLEMNDFPLRFFERWLPSDLKLESVANAKADIKYLSADAKNETLLAQVDVSLPAGSINYPMLSGENDRREYRDGKVRITLNADGLVSTTELTMANGDQISAQLALPGVNPLAANHTDQPLKASARFNARDLRLVETFIPEIYDLKGELNVNLNASGTLDRPVITGNASLVKGALQIPTLGLNIDEIALNSQSDGSQKINFRLDARSGDGKLAITGFTVLDRNAGWPTEITIKGDQFEASRIPEARLLVSPDLLIKLKNHTFDITGKVDIPYAKLQPKDITQAANVSKDTVIIGGDQPAEEKWLITTDVRLTLGERVHFYGFGFEGRLGGSLLLQDEPGQLTKATGEITIPEGTYRAYGQRLEVENGRILYTGGPLTNPGLDIRAVRKVNNVTAGIYVKGTLNEPKLEIFSYPAMGQTDALAYILLGGPIENASNEDGAMMAKAALALGLSGGDSIARSLGDRFGLDEMRVESSDKGDQAALVVGRYLSPRLYASYGVGLIDSVNILTLRYRITNKWQIKAESGNDHGADILYTFER